MNIKTMTSTPNTTEFYPTPPKLVEKILDKIDFDYAFTFLEPSAGKGDIAEALLRRCCAKWRNKDSFEIDCIEIDPHLQQVLKYHFSEEAHEALYSEFSELDRISYKEITSEQKERRSNLRKELDVWGKAEQVRLVGDNFLKYHTHKYYSWIVMNPPFSNGDLHLLHALQLQKDGGNIVCLLNAETIRNPYTKTRVLLMQKLEEYGAEIEFLEGEFTNAERQTDVEVALICVKIPNRTQWKSNIWDSIQREQEVPEEEMDEPDELATSDFISGIVQQYENEVEATTRLIKEYKSLIPYTLNSSPLIYLVRDRSNGYGSFSVNAYLQDVRLKYWEALFSNEKFTGLLTSNLRDKYAGMVRDLKNYEFSEFNIKRIYLEMMSEMTTGVEETIMNLFDKLTSEHSWYPECSKNVHYFNGWRTNKAHFIGNKVILPVNGMFSSYKWRDETFDVRNAYAVVADIQKSLDYLDMGHTGEVNLQAFLEAASQAGQTRNIRCKYFDIDLFKKGTMHIKFHPESQKLIDRFNIYAAQKRGWLPPSYGKKAYSHMTPEEKAVVDSFQGKEKYNQVLAERQYYLAEVTQQVFMLGA